MLLLFSSVSFFTLIMMTAFDLGRFHVGELGKVTWEKYDPTLRRKIRKMGRFTMESFALIITHCLLWREMVFAARSRTICHHTLPLLICFGLFKEPAQLLLSSISFGLRIGYFSGVLTAHDKGLTLLPQTSHSTRSFGKNCLPAAVLR